MLPYDKRCHARAPGAHFSQPDCITRKGHAGPHCWPCPATIEEPGLFSYNCELLRGHAGSHVVHWEE